MQVRVNALGEDTVALSLLEDADDPFGSEDQINVSFVRHDRPTKTKGEVRVTRIFRGEVVAERHFKI